MSYLARSADAAADQDVMAPRKASAANEAATAAASSGGVSAPPTPSPRPAAPEGLTAQPPVLPPGRNKQVYLPVTLTAGQSVKAIADRIGSTITATEKRLVYEPALIGFATVRFVDRKLAIDESQDMTFLTSPEADSTMLS